MKKKILFLFVFILLVGSVYAIVEIQQNSEDNFVTLASSDQSNRRGQNFTVVDGSFIITDIELNMSFDAGLTSGNLSLGVYNTDANGLPTGNAIANGSIDVQVVSNPNDPILRNITLENKAILSNGSVYAFTARCENCNAQGTGVAIQSGNPYPLGTGLRSIDDGGTWTVENSDFRFKILGDQNPIVELQSPDTNINIIADSQEFNASVLGVDTLYNATLHVWHANGSIFNNSLTTDLSGSSDIASFNLTNLPILNDMKWNVEAFGNDSVGNLVSSFSVLNRTFTRNVVVISSNFSGTTTETQTETFNQNVSIPDSSTISYVNLTWGGGDRGGSFTQIVGNNYSLFKSFDIPIGNGNKSFSWNITFDNGFEQQMDTNTQTVRFLNISVNGNPYTTPFINFTFKNETTSQEPVSASVPSSTWTYWLGDGLINKSFTFSSASELPEYVFSVTPADVSLKTQMDLAYTNTDSQQRFFNLDDGLLTNSTTNKILYLLPTSLGIFSPFQVVDNNGDAIAQALAQITRTLGGSSISVTSDYSDDSGFMTFFLNPDVTYTGAVSKTGFATETFTFVPSSDTRTVILGGGDSGLGNGTQIGLNTTYDIIPKNSSLNNDTDILFAFNVTSTQPIDFISMNVTNEDGIQVGYQSNPGAGFISQTINTGNNKTFVGRYVIQTSEERTSFTKIYTIGATFSGDYSFFRQFSLFSDYQFEDFIRILIALFFIIGIMAWLSNTETIDTAESKIAVVLILVWTFSIVGWLDTGLVTSSASQNINRLAEFSSQFGIAILSTGAAAFFIFKRVFT